MNKIDLIIDALDRVDTFDWNQQDNKLIKDARIAARELKALKPVAYMDKKGLLFNNTTHPHLNTALYALDEAKHD